MRTRELRTCRGCGKQDFTTHEWGGLNLFHYGVRHYAHATCLIKLIGWDGILALPSHVLAHFPVLTAQSAGKLEALMAVTSERRSEGSKS